MEVGLRILHVLEGEGERHILVLGEVGHHTLATSKELVTEDADRKELVEGVGVHCRIEKRVVVDMDREQSW